jgi:hypothetical protein
MAVTIPTEWQNVSMDEIRSREIIADGGKLELEGHIRQHNRTMSADVPINLGLLDCRTRGLQECLVVGVYRRVALGRMRPWSLRARYYATFQGSDVEVRVTIGGALVIAGAIGVFGWANTGTGQPLGAAVSAEGLVDVLIEARLTDPAGVLWRVGLTEVQVPLVDMPDGSAAFSTEVIAMDDAAIDPDAIYDAYLVQRVTLNARAIQWERSRRHLHLYPATTEAPNRRHALHSAFWRLDGPYVVTGQPWCDKALVDLTVEASSSFGEFVQLMAFSELEDFEELKDSRAVSVNPASGAQSYAFEVPIRSDIESQTLIWVAFKSDVNSTTESTVSVWQAPVNEPDILYCNDNPFLYGSQNGQQYAALGLVGFAVSDEVPAAADPTIKNALPYSPPSAFFDITCIEGTDPSPAVPPGTAGRFRVRMSPHRGTGYVDGASFQTINDPAGGVIIFQSRFDIRQCGVLYLYGVYIEARPDSEPEYDRVGRPQTPPRASSWRRINNATNAQINYGSAQLISRHPGRRQITTQIGPTGSGAIIYAAGKYLHATAQRGGAVASISYFVPILQDPNLGVVTEQITRTLFAKAWLMVLHNDGTQSDREAEIEFSIAGAPTVVTTAYFPVLPSRPMAGQQPTEADAGVSASASVTWVDQFTSLPIVPQATVSNAQAHELTWPRQGQTLELPWFEGPTFELDLLALGLTYPSDVLIEIKSTADSERAVSIVVAGLTVWCGPRT